MYGHQIEIAGPFDQALERVKAAPMAEGFGVLSCVFQPIVDGISG